MLAPTLRQDDIVLFEEFEQPQGTRRCRSDAAQTAQLIYLPPYSPDLNPIEQAFATFKTALRRAAERTRDALWRTIGGILERYQPQECRTLFKNAGYPN